MKTYCLAISYCRKHTNRKHKNNGGSWNTTMTNKVIRNKSRCGFCLPNKPRSTIKKVVRKYYKTNMVTYCLKCKRKTKSKEEG